MVVVSKGDVNAMFDLFTVMLSAVSTVSHHAFVRTGNLRSDRYTGADLLYLTVVALHNGAGQGERPSGDERRRGKKHPVLDTFLSGRRILKRLDAGSQHQDISRDDEHEVRQSEPAVEVRIHARANGGDHRADANEECRTFSDDDGERFETFLSIARNIFDIFDDFTGHRRQGCETEQDEDTRSERVVYCCGPE